MTPLKLVVPADGANVSVGWAAWLLLTVPPLPLRSDKPASVWLVPSRSRVAPPAICTGAVVGKAPWAVAPVKYKELIWAAVSAVP